MSAIFSALRVSIFLLAFVATSAMAQSGDRKGTWDVGVGLTNIGSLNVAGQQGSGLSTNSEFGFGLWGSYNFTNRLALGFDVNWVQPRYTATFVPENSPTPETINARLDMFSIQGKGVFHFMEGPISPFIEAGFGWTNVDSNIISGPPITGCWWDPWWGYICDTFFSTYSENLTSYSAAAGLRWDFNNYYGMRAAYGILELDTRSGTENAQFDMWRVEFAWRF